MPADNTLLMEDARVIFRNFAGKEGKYNREGDRNFCVLLDADLAEVLERDGWNVKALRAREEGDPDQPYLQVSVSYKGRPPAIVMITSRGRTNIPEDQVEVLDWVDIRQVDLLINPYHWNVNGKGGVKAYLRSLYITINEDALELKYRDIPEIGYDAPRAIESAPMWEAEELDQLPARAGRVDEG